MAKLSTSAAISLVLSLAISAACAAGGDAPPQPAAAAPTAAPQTGYKNLSICVYFRYQETASTPNNMAQFAQQWANLEKQVHVSKVYLETTRNGMLATEAQVETLKKFFTDRGIKVSAGLGLTVNEGNGFQSYNYVNQADRDKVKAMTEFTAKHFDEIILDDFFFTNVKDDATIAAKGDKSWSQFRTELMDDVSKNLIVGPAKAVNPKCHVIIKYPNWYESFQGLGYDLAQEPKIFDAIYTGTETRNASAGQRLQSYQSFLQTQYFNNIKPGGNQGGWIDGGGYGDSDRYAEQMWDTFFAKVPEIMLFNSMQIMGNLGGGGGRGGFGGPGGRGAAAPAAPAPAADPNAPQPILAKLMDPIPQPDGTTYTPNNVARIAGYSAEILDTFLGKLGKPVGLAVYKPANSTGDEYLPNFLGTVGIPMDLVPDFPDKAPAVLLTAASAYDKDLVAKTKKFVQAGGRVIATTTLMEALGDKGFQDIAEIQVYHNRVIAKTFAGGGGRGGFGGGFGGPQPTTAPADLNIVMPQLHHFENDTWTGLNFQTADFEYPMAVSASYGKGTFYALALPDDTADIYRLPVSVLNQLRGLLGHDLFVSLNAPDHVSLFAYDNRTFIVQNFQGQPVTATVAVTQAQRLHDLLTDQLMNAGGGIGAAGGGRGGAGGRGGFGGGGFGGAGGGGGARGNFGGAGGTQFELTIPAHSFRVFAAE